MPPRRSLAERRAASAAGLDRFGRPLPSVLAKTFDRDDRRCYICGATADLRLLGTWLEEFNAWRDYAYRCRSVHACRDRARA